MRFVAAFCVVIASFMASPLTVLAQDLALTDAVAGHLGLTYFDLVGQFMPGLELTDKGGTAPGNFEIRHIEGDEQTGGEPDMLPGPVFIGTLGRIDFEAEGQQRIALFARTSSGPQMYYDSAAVLAVFTGDPTPKFLDLVDVTMDSNVGMATPPVLRIGPHDEALMAVNSHFNSQEGYGLRTLIMVRDDKFQRIDTFNTLAVRYCSFSTNQALSFVANGDAGQAYWPITATIDQTHEPGEESCDLSREPTPRDLTVSVTYVWNTKSSSYVGEVAPFEALDQP